MLNILIKALTVNILHKGVHKGVHLTPVFSVSGVLLPMMPQCGLLHYHQGYNNIIVQMRGICLPGA